MKVAKDRVVAIEYTIRDGEGQIVDTTLGRSPFTYLHGHEQIVRGVEAALDGHDAGTAMDLWVSPRDAYGQRDPKGILVVPRRAFPIGQEPAAGDTFRANRRDGRTVLFSVLDVTDDTVIVDANHPLAGQTLNVHVEVVSVRKATPEEQAHQHVHADAVVSTSQLA